MTFFHPKDGEAANALMICDEKIVINVIRISPTNLELFFFYVPTGKSWALQITQPQTIEELGKATHWVFDRRVSELNPAMILKLLLEMPQTIEKRPTEEIRDCLTTILFVCQKTLVENSFLLDSEKKELGKVTNAITELLIEAHYII